MTQTINKNLEETSGYILLHRAIERNLRLLEQHSSELSNPDISKVQKINQWWDEMWLIIEHHHVNEDKVVFPVFFERVPGLKEQMDGLTADHHVLDDLVVKMGGFLKLAQKVVPNREAAFRQFVDTLTTFNSLMFDHLKREEVIVLETEATYFTEEELEAMEAQIMKNTPMGVLALEAPFLFYGVPERVEKNFIKNSPLILRLIYRLSWKPKFMRKLAKYMA